MSDPALTCGAHLVAGVIVSSLHCPAVPPLGTVLPFLHLLAHWDHLEVTAGGRERWSLRKNLTLQLILLVYPTVDAN